jgi:hypothetical protein
MDEDNGILVFPGEMIVDDGNIVLPGEMIFDDGFL